MEDLEIYGTYAVTRRYSAHIYPSKYLYDSIVGLFAQHTTNRCSAVTETYSFALLQSFRRSCGERLERYKYEALRFEGYSSVLRGISPCNQRSLVVPHGSVREKTRRAPSEESRDDWRKREAFGGGAVNLWRWLGRICLSYTTRCQILFSNYTCN